MEGLTDKQYLQAMEIFGKKFLTEFKLYAVNTLDKSPWEIADNQVKEDMKSICAFIDKEIELCQKKVIK